MHVPRSAQHKFGGDILITVIFSNPNQISVRFLYRPTTSVIIHTLQTIKTLQQQIKLSRSCCIPISSNTVNYQELVYTTQISCQIYSDILVTPSSFLDILHTSFIQITIQTNIQFSGGYTNI